MHLICYFIFYIIYAVIVAKSDTDHIDFGLPSQRLGVAIAS
ncbi:MAG: hypothetical protein P2A85_24350 [Microcoleus anatoxicus]|uniref:Uncharacterized protein n=1 Tax=Microcoleus anatoxicus PTRS2 TaxID=2705321 RepID=A0ABU8YL04_9CYAN